MDNLPPLRTLSPNVGGHVFTIERVTSPSSHDFMVQWKMGSLQYSFPSHFGGDFATSTSMETIPKKGHPSQKIARRTTTWLDGFLAPRISSTPSYLVLGYFPHLKKYAHVKLRFHEMPRRHKNQKDLKPTFLDRKNKYPLRLSKSNHAELKCLYNLFHPRCRRGHCRKANPLQTSMN